MINPWFSSFRVVIQNPFFRINLHIGLNVLFCMSIFFIQLFLSNFNYSWWNNKLQLYENYNLISFIIFYCNCILYNVCHCVCFRHNMNFFIVPSWITRIFTIWLMTKQCHNAWKLAKARLDCFKHCLDRHVREKVPWWVSEDPRSNKRTLPQPKMNKHQ